MKKSVRQKTLSLSAQALRVLSSEEVRTVQGGAIYATRALALTCVKADCCQVAI
jgi:hypothetical protein